MGIVLTAGRVLLNVVLVSCPPSPFWDSKQLPSSLPSDPGAIAIPAGQRTDRLLERMQALQAAMRCAAAVAFDADDARLDSDVNVAESDLERAARHCLAAEAILRHWCVSCSYRVPEYPRAPPSLRSYRARGGGAGGGEPVWVFAKRPPRHLRNRPHPDRSCATDPTPTASSPTDPPIPVLLAPRFSASHRQICPPETSQVRCS